MLIYDIEILKAISGKNEERLPHIDYCEGWHDHANMGISCICAYDYVEDRYRVFAFVNHFDEFRELIAKRDIIVGFNNIGFDNKVMVHAGFDSDVLSAKSYDLLQQIWIGEGLEDHFVYPTHIGYGLDDVCKANFGVSKSGHGASAPVQWQRGEYGKVIDYCLNDIRLTKRLLDHVIAHGCIRSPKNYESVIRVRRPN
ncbi:MAG: hypothetical protein CV087_22085 [Candidatus Brocadia sp. WS118]|nr:MAG: hypothetical protein CV087_22085 [Candidatus Brocadia sp. WS118]